METFSSYILVYFTGDALFSNLNSTNFAPYKVWVPVRTLYMSVTDQFVHGLHNLNIADSWVTRYGSKERRFEV